MNEGTKIGLILVGLGVLDFVYCAYLCRKGSFWANFYRVKEGQDRLFYHQLRLAILSGVVCTIGGLMIIWKSLIH